MSSPEEVVIVGAGLVGAAVAYQMAIRQERARLILIADRDPARDQGPPELDVYSIWWPGPDDTMLRLVSRSIDLLEGVSDLSNGSIGMNRRGQLLVTTRSDGLSALRVAAGRMAGLGFGPLREHVKIDWYLPSPITGFRGVPDGFDLFERAAAARASYPFLAAEIAGALHVRRAGWVDGVALRRWLMIEARSLGVEVVHDTAVAIQAADDRGPRVALASGATWEAAAVVACPERRMRATLNLLGTPLPLWDAPRVQARLAAGADRILPDAAPVVTGIDRPGGGLHARPTSDHAILGAWIPETPAGSADEIASNAGAGLLGALAELVPAAATHRGPSSALRTESSIQARTADLRPIVGPVAPGVLLNAAHDRPTSSALAAGDLVARYVFGEPLPDFAGGFTVDRLTATGKWEGGRGKGEGAASQRAE